MKDSFPNLIFTYPDYIIDVGYSKILQKTITIYTN